MPTDTRQPTHEELERLPWLQGDEAITAEYVLPPCEREGELGLDWWREQHDFCTGGQHVAAATVELCACGCHQVRAPHLVMPRPIA